MAPVLLLKQVAVTVRNGSPVGLKRFFLILDCSTDFSHLYIATIRRKLHGLCEKNSGLALITAIGREMTLQLDVSSNQSATICLHVCQGIHTAMFCLFVKCFNLSIFNHISGLDAFRPRLFNDLLNQPLTIQANS